MMKRIFLGIPVPASIKESLRAYTEAIADESFRFVKPENYHITVSFFGEQEGRHIPAISEAITNATATSKPFTLNFDTISFAPPKREPSMIWAQYLATEPFTALVSSIEDGLRGVIEFQDQRNGHVPIPHITLARFKHTNLKSLPQIKLDPIAIHELALLESKVSQAGRIYETITTFSLHS